MKIAICITTRNRPDIFSYSIANQRIHKPHEAKIFVVDDHSDVPVSRNNPQFDDEEWYYAPRQMGIPNAKNKCLAMAVEWGAEEIFLFDDDCWPIARNWHRPYINHPEPHLMYQFKLKNKGVKDMRELYRDEQTVAYSHTRGAMIYVNKVVLDTVGGLDTEYGLGMYEHPDWTNRIHNAGLTTYRAMDVPNSSKYLYCLDEFGAAVSSIPDIDRQSGKIHNSKTYLKSKTSKEYKEYR